MITALLHPQPKFTGPVEVTENLESNHQSFVNLCRTFKLTQNEALDSLHALFTADSEAGRYYHKHVVSRARIIDEAFGLMYSRFMAESISDRLLRIWNNWQFSNFMNELGTTRHKALHDLCSTASSIQLQIGESYHHEQHLRDALMSACKNQA